MSRAPGMRFWVREWFHTTLRHTDANTGDAILVVDDDPGVRTFVCRFLKTKGFKVLEAGGAEAAKRALFRSPNHVGLLLTDVCMPGMSGPELAADLLDLYPGLRVIYMSGMADEELLKQPCTHRDFLF